MNCKIYTFLDIINQVINIDNSNQIIVFDFNDDIVIQHNICIKTYLKNILSNIPDTVTNIFIDHQYFYTTDYLQLDFRNELKLPHTCNFYIYYKHRPIKYKNKWVLYYHLRKDNYDNGIVIPSKIRLKYNENISETIFRQLSFKIKKSKFLKI